MSAEKSDSVAVDTPRATSPVSLTRPPEDARAAPDDSSTSWQHHDNNAKWWLLVLCVLCCTLLYSLDNSILADVAPV